MHRLWLISYDVACPRRRRQLDKTLLPLGERVLESLFECWLSAAAARSLQAQLRALLNAEEDRLALLPVCADCQRRVVDLGAGRPTDAGACTHGPGEGALSSRTPSEGGVRRGRTRTHAWLI
jgi:CRISPR-associated protein Cas2